MLPASSPAEQAYQHPAEQAYQHLRHRLSLMMATWPLSSYERDVIAADLHRAERLAAGRTATRPREVLAVDQEPTAPQAPRARLQGLPHRR